MRAKRMGAALFCALLVCVGMCACTAPAPADAPEIRCAETDDDTSTVTGIVIDSEWGDSVEIGY